jgi:hypothetical protein
MPTDVEPAPHGPERSSGELSTLRRLLALVVALAADGLSVWTELLPPAQWTLDLATAFLLFALLSFRWWLLPALVIEAIPGLGVFPTWTLAVAAILASKTPRQP